MIKENNEIAEPTCSSIDTYRNRKKIYTPVAIGTICIIASIYIGNAKIMFFAISFLALIMTLLWQEKNLFFITTVSMITAMPQILTVAPPVIFGFFFLLFGLHRIKKIPSWLVLILFFFCLSTTASVVRWNETNNIFLQLAHISNYILGPFLFIPLIYFRLENETDYEFLLEIFIVSLLLPTTIILFITRKYGTPINFSSMDQLDGLININVYQLKEISVIMTRTQVGPVLAVLTCSSIAILLTNITHIKKSVAAIAFIFLLLLTMSTGSMGSILSGVIALGLMLFLNIKNIRIKNMVFALPLTVILCYFSWMLAPEQTKEYIVGRYEDKTSSGTIKTSDRTSRWTKSLAYLLQNPTGRGWQLRLEEISSYPHNDYISYGIAFGIFCSLLYLSVPIIILSSMLTSRDKNKSQAQTALYLAGVGATVVLLVNSSSDHLSANRLYFNVIWSIIWFCYFASRSKKGKVLGMLQIPVDTF
ncbi:MAG: O-antigen ligase domain-containing protein [Candidatus Electrothrix sp. AR3]|nr:O-antigen ligase domain-containing protein [Candidatus Electrothrix sp. AR3]